MGETQWVIEEVKRLKKKQLVQNNLLMLLIFVLFGYLVECGQVYALFGLCSIFFWVIAAITLYTLITGKTIGTKISRRVQQFDRDRLGEKRWKRRKMIEAALILVLSIGMTILLFIVDFDTLRFHFPANAFPFIGAWVGYNIGEGIRIGGMREY